jgi:hypothetical protein
MDTIKVSVLCSAGTIVKSHTVPGHNGASRAESDEYGIGLCEAVTTADWVQWKMNSCKCFVSPMMLSCTHHPVLCFCDGVTAFEKPLGYSSLSWWTAPGYLLSTPVTSSQVPLDMAFILSLNLISLLSNHYNMDRLRLSKSVSLLSIWF